MLYFIAQPTRKHPEALPQYEKLYENNRPARPPKTREKNGEEILKELLGR